MPSHKKFYRHKLLLDEGIPVKKLLPRLNQRHDVKHIRDDFHKGGLEDRTVYAFASRQKRVIVTFNGDDYKNLIHASGAGVIYLSSTLTPEQIDKKTLALLSKITPKNSVGKLFKVTGEKTT